MIWLIAAAGAADICPDPPGPQVVDLDYACTADGMDLDVRVVDEDQQVWAGWLEVWTLDGAPVEQIDLTLSDYQDTTSVWSLHDHPFDCQGEWLLRAVAEDTLGNTGSRELTLNAEPLITNAGFEENLYAWGTGGNAAIETASHDDVQPYSGTRMLELGWPRNTQAVYGYAWQNVGELDPGTYTLTGRFALMSDERNALSDGSCRDEPQLYVGLNRDVDDSFDVVDGTLFTGGDVCHHYNRTTSHGWMVSDWQELDVTFDVDTAETLYLFFNVFGGYAQWGHLVYLDALQLRAGSVGLDEPEQLFVGVSEREVSLGDWDGNGRWYDHVERELNAAYEGWCAGCQQLDGQYNGSWGIDGVFYNPTDGSVLLLESKARSAAIADADAAVTYLNTRIHTSDLVKCAGPCFQGDPQWLKATVRDLCAKSDVSKRLAGQRIEQAWQQDKLYWSWATAGADDWTTGAPHAGWVFAPDHSPEIPYVGSVCTE